MATVYRRPAVKIRVRDLIEGEFAEGDQQTRVLKTCVGVVDCVNIIGVVVSKSDSNFVVDDGSGSVLMRNFDEGVDVDVGDSVLVIGSPRVFHDSKYVVLEVVKRVDFGWVAVRQKELGLQRVENPGKELCDLIKRMDSGDGVSVDDIKMKDVDVVLEILLQKGEVFEVRPGVVRVLE